MMNFGQHVFYMSFIYKVSLFNFFFISPIKSILWIKIIQEYLTMFQLQIKCCWSNVNLLSSSFLSINTGLLYFFKNTFSMQNNDIKNAHQSVKCKEIWNGWLIRSISWPIECFRYYHYLHRIHFYKWFYSKHGFFDNKFVVPPLAW